MLNKTEKGKLIVRISAHVDPILIGYGGSIAYGTNLPTSDVDIRGIYINPVDEFIGTKPDSEQYTDNESDTVVYSIKKMFSLLSQCNPNVIELLGLKPEHYIFVSGAGQKILDNAELFLSKRAIYTFGNYAKAQLNRLVNKSGRAKEDPGSNEVRSLQKSISSIRKNVPGLIMAENTDAGPTVFLKGDWPIDVFCRFAGEIINVHSDYKDSNRNRNAVDHGKIAKHMMHLIRLYMMGIDILESRRIVTYREAEHDLLMDIRNGKYLEADGVTPTSSFQTLLDKYLDRFEKACTNTTLPEKADLAGVNRLMKEIVGPYIAECYGKEKN